MRSSPSLLLLLLAALAFPTAVLAQDSTGDANTDPDDAAEAEAEAEGQTEQQAQPEQAPPPDYNGTASGVLSGTPFRARVVCERTGDGVHAQSDPEGGGQDLDGDGVVVDVTGYESGQIVMALMAGGISFDFDDDTAEYDGETLRYSVTISFVGGGDDTIQYTIECDD